MWDFIHDKNSNNDNNINNLNKNDVNNNGYLYVLVHQVLQAFTVIDH